MIIKQITASEILVIRQQVMWPNKPLSYVMLSNDETGKHYGLFLGDKIISVVSVFVNGTTAQFRKFATLVEFQGKGYGTFLLKKVINDLENNNIRKIWCNARENKTEFYKKFGLKCTEKRFERDGIWYVIMEKYSF